MSNDLQSFGSPKPKLLCIKYAYISPKNEPDWMKLRFVRIILSFFLWIIDDSILYPKQGNMTPFHLYP